MTIKKTVLGTLLMLSLHMVAQKPCEFTSNTKDSLGTYKSLKDHLMYEKNFAGNANYVFFSLESNNGTPNLNVNFIKKSKDFLTANCFDSNSKIFFQLDNGKIVTLIFGGNENCGSLIRDDKGYDNRLLNGVFMFVKGSLEDLKSAAINLMRVKYLSEIEDFVVKKEIQSELNGQTYQPESFFLNYVHCIE